MDGAIRTPAGSTPAPRRRNGCTVDRLRPTRSGDSRLAETRQGYPPAGPPRLAENAPCRRTTMTARDTTGPRTLRQSIALAFGAIYLLVGIVGFFITGFDNFFGHTDETLLVFDINP